MIATGVRRRSFTLLILARIGWAIPVLLGVTLLVFWAVDRAPGDPATAALGPFATEEQREQFAEEHGLNDPMPVRYVRFLGGLAGGDLGRSAVRPVKVGDLVAQAWPVTLQLTLLAAILAAAGSSIAGTLAATRFGLGTDLTVRMGTTAGLAAPDFWIGILAIELLISRLGWFPPGGYVPMGDSLSGWLHHLILPATVLAIPLGASLTIIVRASMIQELDKDYVRTMMGSGLTKTKTVRSVFRNAASGPLTVLGLRVAFLLSGAIVTEQIFNLPGLGTLLIQGVRQGDLAVVRAVTLIGAFGVVMVSLLADIGYLILNPRVRT